MKLKYTVSGTLIYEGEGETPRIGERVHFIPAEVSYRVRDIKRILHAGAIPKTLRDEGEVEVLLAYHWEE